MPASITLTVAHLPTSTSFFLACLQPLNYIYRGRVNDTIGFGHPDAAPDFWITQSIPGVPPGPAHVAFPAISRGKVHEFFHAALKAGAKCHGEPALRDDCGYYSAAIIDFDGNSIEAVFRPDLLEDNKENMGDAKSMAGMTKSVAQSKTPTVVSSPSKAKTVAPSKVGSVAPSATAKSSASKAPSVAHSKAPSQAPSQAARSTVSRSTVSRAPTVTGTPSEAPARTTISRAPTAPAAPQRSGNNYMDMLNEAKGTISFAREMVNQARPIMSPSEKPSSPDSHTPSDAIVGTLLGVAAGAALHYAFSNRNKPTEVASAPVTPPDNRSETAPSYSQQRYYYYHQQGALPASSETGARPYAIEAPPTQVSRTTSRSGPRLIEMVDNDATLSQVASTVRPTPRRRSSFSAVSTSRSGIKMLEAPPSAYRIPTASTAAPSKVKSHSSRRSSRPTDEGYASATDDKRSKISRHGSHHGSHGHRSRRSSKSTVTMVKSPEQHDSDRDSYYTSASKPSKTKTVIGRLTEKQLSKLEDGGRLDKGNTDVTRSVIGKVKAVDRLDLSGKELRPEDSVSQISGSSRRRK